MAEAAPLRFEVASRHGFADGRALRLLPGLQREVSPLIRDIRIIDVYIVHGAPGLRTQHAREVLADAVSQEVSVRASVGAPARAHEGASWRRAR